LKLTLTPAGPNHATVAVKSGGFTDAWRWQSATGKFTSATLHGFRKGGFDVTVNGNALPPAPASPPSEPPA
jgi:hypothetical protein